MKWFLAEILVIVKNRSKGTCRTNVNFVLIEATSADDAYSKAVELGAMENRTFEGNDGDVVDVEYRGLKNLHHIYEPTLSHGAELLYEEVEGCASEDVENLVRPKHELNVFARADRQSSTPY